MPMERVRIIADSTHEARSRGMSQRTARMRLLVAGLVWWGSVSLAQAQTVAQILSMKPKCDDAPVSEPKGQDLAACKLDNVKNAAGTTIGWLVVDGQNRPVRKFLDNSGSGRV